MQILPSGAQPASVLTLAPFRGLRYAQDRVSGLAEVTSPPYDVIAHDTADHLLASDPHNVVRLILPRHDPGNTGAAHTGVAGLAPAGPGNGAATTGNAYDEAARLLRDWQAEGILVPDPEPALYVYEQSLPAGPVLQRGLIGALQLAPLGAGPVLPHEDVIPGPVTGRRQLMEATGANLEPIFLLYDGPDGPGAAGDLGGPGGPTEGFTAWLIAEVAERREPLLSIDTDDGIRHRLWAVTDSAEQDAITADLAARQALIADGHHRYAAYLQLQARKRTEGAGAGPWDAGLALLVDSAAFPPRIGAIHRVLPGLTPDKAVYLAKGAFCVTPLPGGSEDLAAALAALDQAATAGPAFLVAGSDTAYLLSEPDPVQAEAAMPDGLSATWRGLGYAVLQQLLITRLWGLRDDDRSVRIVHNDAATAIAEAGRVLRPGGLLITTVGKNDAAFEAAGDDAAAIMAPVRARFGHDQTDRLARVADIGGRHRLAPAAQTTFVGLGQGVSPRRWRQRLAGDATEWIGAAGRERVDALCAELGRLPDQERARPDPVYQLAALRKG